MTRTDSNRDRGVSFQVNYITTLSITTILVVGLVMTTGAFVNNQTERAAEHELEAIGNRIATQIDIADDLAARGGNVSMTITQPRNVVGKAYSVELARGSTCDSPVVGTDNCLLLEAKDPGVLVKVPVTNVSVVQVEQVSGGQFRVEASPASAAGSSITSSAQDDLDMTVGVGQNIGVGATNGTSLDLSNNQPTAKFTMNPGNPTNASNVEFTSKSTDPDGAITKYKWDFDNDGTVEATGESVTYSFSEPGRYVVNLTVTDDDGVTSSTNKTVTVGGLVYRRDVTVRDADSDGRNSTVVFNVTNIHKDKVTILDMSVHPARDSIDQLRGNPGLGDVSEDPIEMYTNLNKGPPPWAGGPGGPPGGPGGPPGGPGGGTPLDFNDQVEVAGNPIQIHDDGVIVSSNNRTEITPGKSFAVVFSEFRSLGAPVEMADENITVGIRYRIDGEYYASVFDVHPGGTVVNQPPNATFTSTCTNYECEFDASGSSDDDGIASYNWQFGDGSTATGLDPKHTYAHNGTYTVTLTVADTDGTIASQTKQVSVGGIDFDLDVNMQPDGAPVPDGYLVDNGSTYGDHDGPVDYGWVKVSGGTEEANPVRHRATRSDQRFDTLNHMGVSKNSDYLAWKVDVPDDGRYRLYWVMGDPSYTDQTNDVTVGGRTIEDRDGEDNFDRYSTVVNASDTLTIEPRSSSDNAKLAFVEISNVDTRPFDATSGGVVIEAEHYQRLTPGNDNDVGPDDGDDMTGVMWWRLEDPDASGDRALVVDQDSAGDLNAEDTENGPRLDYKVDFETTGTYYVWVRMKCSDGANDSIHVGLDGDPKTFGGYGFGDDCQNENGWTWERHWLEDSYYGTDQEILEVGISSGVHTVNIWVREDGVKIDKIIVVRSPYYTPSGEGPAESDRVIP